MSVLWQVKDVDFQLRPFLTFWFGRFFWPKSSTIPMGMGGLDVEKFNTPIPKIFQCYPL